MTSVPPVVLVTGFDPFDGRPVNASWQAVEGLAAAWDGPAQLVVLRLPVTFRGARQALRTAIAAHDPGVVVCVGEAGDRSAVGLERVAVNIVDAPVPDNDGSAPVDVPVIAGAPAAFFATLPLKACLVAVRRAGVPVEVSNSAGTYVCNATFYALLHLLERTSGARGGFVHVPRTPEQRGDVGGGLITQDAVVALDAVVRAALAAEPDLARRSGDGA